MTIPTPEPRQRRWRVSWSRQRISGLLWQIAVVGIAIAVVGWLWSNALHNLSARRISTGFAFLGREAGMPIADSWLAYSPKDPYIRAFIVGIVNTLRVAVIGIVLATVLGTGAVSYTHLRWRTFRRLEFYKDLRSLPARPRVDRQP